MNIQISRFDLLIAFALGAVIAIAGGHLSPAAAPIQTQRDVAIIIPSAKASPPRDPDAGAMDATPDSNNWDPRDGETHYGQKSGPDDDQDDDDDDDLDSSYDLPDPADVTPI